MRPPAKPNSFFYHPLDAVLGTVAAVRILRFLSLQRWAMPPVLIAARCRLGRAGTGRALARLKVTGIVEPSGGGRYPKYQLASSNPLAGVVRELFERESALRPPRRRLRRVAR